MLHRAGRSPLLFLMGVTVGLTVSLLLTSLQQMASRSPSARNTLQLLSHRPALEHLLNASVRATTPQGQLPPLHQDDDRKARELYDKVRVLVWVMTGPQNLDKRAVHVRNTWGRRANKLLFMSSTWNATFPTVGLDVTEGRQHLTAKTMKAFQYVYEHHAHDADWFMKADDDTYVIMENLRYMLLSYDTNDPIYFGKVFKTIVKQGYASGGAGYVLSKEALRRLVQRGSNSSVCRQDGGAEDASIGRCLSKLGVTLMPSTDRQGRSRFHCFGPEAQLQGGFPKWFFRYDVHGGRTGLGNISEYPITFHYIKPKIMHAMEYFVYHLRPYGVIFGTETPTL